MRLSQNQYYGLDRNKPSTLLEGSTYSAVDTSILYLYGQDQKPYPIKTGFSSSGFMDYNDTTGAIALIEDTWTDVPNNGEGSFTNKEYKPESVSELMDTDTGYINVEESSLGQSILVRNDYSINPNTNNALLQFRYVLGDGVDE